MIENMYRNMAFDELARETWHSENKLAKALLEKHDELIETERAGAEAIQIDTMIQLDSCLEEMNGMLQILVNDLIAAKGTKRKSQEAIQRFKENCENMPIDYLETFSILWDIDYE